MTDSENQIDKKYKRVTEILQPFNGLQHIDKEVIANAGRRGTLVHKICESIISGLGKIGVTEEVAGYIKSFEKWYRPEIQVIEMERRFYDDELMVTGQVDLIIKENDEYAIVDFKTSSKYSKTWPIQGSAYANMAKKAGYDIKKIYFVQLKRNGHLPKIYVFEPNFPFFLEIYKVYQYFFGDAACSN